MDDLTFAYLTSSTPVSLVNKLRENAYVTAIASDISADALCQFISELSQRESLEHEQICLAAAASVALYAKSQVHRLIGEPICFACSPVIEGVLLRAFNGTSERTEVLSLVMPLAESRQIHSTARRISLYVPGSCDNQIQSETSNSISL
jgi:hypothetical protein